MIQLNFSYKILPYNINKIFITDLKITRQIEGYKVKDYSYNFKNQIRTITYECKNKNVQKLISKAKKSNIKSLRWEYHDQSGNR
jgi:hypothetical protein